MATILPTLAKAFPPGEFIREELEERGWTQQQLAERIGRPLQSVNMIVNGHKAITAETASQLEKVFGPSAIYWMNLESIWQLYKLGEKKKIAARREKSRTTRELESSSPQPVPIKTAKRDRSLAKNRVALPPEVSGHRVTAKGQDGPAVSTKMQVPGKVAPKPREKLCSEIAAKTQKKARKFSPK